MAALRGGFYCWGRVMSSIFDEMRQAVAEARSTMAAADTVADGMADLLCGRLRHVSPYRLEKLKRELRDFNMHTGQWKK